MVKEQRNEYQPDYVSPPHETLLETLSALGMTQADLARRTGKDPVKINEIVKGKTAITPQTALQFERALGIPASFWNNRQKRYDEFLAAQEEGRSLQSHLVWAKKFPFSRMVKLSWVKEASNGVDKIKQLLDFFGIVSPDQRDAYWSEVQVAYRKSEKFEADPYALAAWLRAGERQAQNVRCAPYDGKKFMTALQSIRKLTVEPPEIFQPRLTEICAECGVAMVFIPELPKIRANGATRWIGPDKALIQLSLRYKFDDHLWFTFFHEAKHVLQDQKKSIFLDASKFHKDINCEIQADKFAAEILIPAAKLKAFLAASQLSKASIKRFAQSIGIAPGIVVGQLQHQRRLPYTHCNDLKRKFRWEELR